jgi:UDP-N-acetylglucosamine 2-epimerase
VGIFFEGLDLPRPDANLAVGPSEHGPKPERCFQGSNGSCSPNDDCVLVYSDTYLTLAGALAAAKLSIPIAYLEAGLPSFNRSMPEEMNRVLADHVSDLLLYPSDTAVRNLKAAGITRNVHVVSVVMLDVLNWAKRRICQNPLETLNRFGLKT